MPSACRRTRSSYDARCTHARSPFACTCRWSDQNSTIDSSTCRSEWIRRSIEWFARSTAYSQPPFTPLLLSVHFCAAVRSRSANQPATSLALLLSGTDVGSSWPRNHAPADPALRIRAKVERE